MFELIKQFWAGTGFANLFTLTQLELFGFNVNLPGNLIMICIACTFLYLAIKKGYEPYLLIPIAFGMLLVNLPLAGLMDHPVGDQNGGLLYYLYQGTNLGIYPPLIFLCIGAGTDFGPLIANPRSLLLGAAAQFGIFFTFLGAIILNTSGIVDFSGAEAASIAIIGGADGPTALYLTSKLAPHLLGPIAIAAYSYMALVPIIQPPIMKALTTEEERKVKMQQLRPVSKTEKILFPIVVSIFTILLLPSSAALIGMLMLGNLFKESGVVPKLTETASNSLLYIVTIALGITVGAKANAVAFLNTKTLMILFLGLAAFSVGTATGILFGKIMYKTSGGKINPLIGAAGVSAVPMAARVVQKEGQKYNPSNFLLMHAMGPNVAGVIGSAVAAGLLLMFFS
ncbi:oxaloacetate decarboxylase beta subunit [Sedimentibacter acidaminivorans]|jgi:carboxybiotin decarboxylase|uniref:Oxaloacetate decarboxylase beta subunit n=1 Tax=Sedimentibacter acidaminivorans TaxID=913099 RepID=A0ABS4GFZ3_9FIRM|nr:sodium ion-translocating decarboxylase subunit beta [Sedimentibacter acidaminivorans]MBP1926567.1 oxaloacetate decarboxylase beta subunit [Sedimentibacter acidaminivorans]